MYEIKNTVQLLFWVFWCFVFWLVSLCRSGSYLWSLCSASLSVRAVDCTATPGLAALDCAHYLTGSPVWSLSSFGHYSSHARNCHSSGLAVLLFPLLQHALPCGMVLGFCLPLFLFSFLKKQLFWDCPIGSLFPSPPAWQLESFKPCKSLLFFLLFCDSFLPWAWEYCCRGLEFSSQHPCQTARVLLQLQLWGIWCLWLLMAPAFTCSIFVF